MKMNYEEYRKKIKNGAIPSDIGKDMTPQDALSFLTCLGAKGYELDMLSASELIDIIATMSGYVRQQETAKQEKAEKTSADIQKIADAWNTAIQGTGIQPVVRITSTSQRAKMLRARVREYGADAVYTAIENVRNSKFLRGDNRTGWTITFDWFVKPNNFSKVLEGNYNDKGRAVNTDNTGYTGYGNSAANYKRTDYSQYTDRW